jgi:general secretion pathway protein G
MRILEALRRRRRNQQGFTLIELLVVITILGILAAIVSISLLGVTANARQKAQKSELQVVQGSFDAMLSDQSVPQAPVNTGTGKQDPTQGPLVAAGCWGGDGNAPGAVIPGTFWTNDMTHFPATGATYSQPNTGLVSVLATHYTRETTTQFQYACDGLGNVFQK